jgi:osmotically-inducible protein OsmY
VGLRLKTVAHGFRSLKLAGRVAGLGTPIAGLVTNSLLSNGRSPLERNKAGAKMVTTKTQRNDSDVQRDVLSALGNNSRLQLSSLQVEADDGTITLRGTVPTVWQKKLAAQTARRVEGVERVLDDLMVGPGSFRTDADIGESIRLILSRDLQIDLSAVNVSSLRGEVKLSGTVYAYAERAAAEEAAWSVPGVSDVQNDMVVQTPAGGRTDQQISAELKANLERNLRLEHSCMQVRVVNGRVYLRGQVPTVIQRVLAEDVAWWTPGVRSVINALAVEPELPLSQSNSRSG